ncbi:hypothetical protein BGZ80_009428 [Entomortierella chlamydospora]|uniref:Uncharacterized protein n=1 Tax=Entomortierella chlamydospora TaxID=101097 RepID=A0A9P6MX75_9FUNG|nr:hypothetical protein BGZ80_009428 [Entomortierella chlamydospora]
MELSEHGPRLESVERNKHLIKHLKIHGSTYDEPSSTSVRDIELSEALKTNSNLTTLDLCRNSIGPNEAQALSEALKASSTLTTLSLRYNSIGPDGARALSDGLKTNSSLIALNFRNNSIGSNGALFKLS